MAKECTNKINQFVSHFCFIVNFKVKIKTLQCLRNHTASWTGNWYKCGKVLMNWHVGLFLKAALRQDNIYLLDCSLYATTITIKMRTERIVQGQSAFCYLVLHFVWNAVDATDHFPHWFFYIYLRTVFMEKCFHSSMSEGHFTSHWVRSTEYRTFLLGEHPTPSFSHYRLNNWC